MPKCLACGKEVEDVVNSRVIPTGEKGVYGLVCGLCVDSILVAHLVINKRKET